MIKKFWFFLEEKLFKINDTPQKIARGFALGVFAGILPGTGPLAALVLAFIFRANAAAALAGSLLTNSWMSLVVLTIALQVGGILTGTEWQTVYQQGQALLKDFHWRNLFSGPVLAVIKPFFVGYAVVSLLLAVIAYGVVLLALRHYSQKGHRPA